MKIKFLILIILLKFQPSFATGGTLPEELIIVGGIATVLVSNLGTSFLVKTSGDVIKDQKGSFLVTYLSGLAGIGIGSLLGLQIGTNETSMQTPDGYLKTKTVSGTTIFVCGTLGMIAGNTVGYIFGPKDTKLNVSYSFAHLEGNNRYGINITNHF
jgi:hypothetical protein